MPRFVILFSADALIHAALLHKSKFQLPSLQSGMIPQNLTCQDSDILGL